MSAGWFIIPYKRDITAGHPVRYCAIDDYSADIASYGGKWSETEILGNQAIVKVNAPAGVLNALAAVDGFQRLPKDRIDDPLSDLSAAAKQKIRDAAIAAGYSLAEIQARFPNDLGTYTLRDVLQFLATRRLKPRYDAQADEIIVDGPEQPCKPVDAVDIEVND